MKYELLYNKPVCGVLCRNSIYVVETSMSQLLGVEPHGNLVVNLQAPDHNVAAVWSSRDSVLLRINAGSKLRRVLVTIIYYIIICNNYVAKEITWAFIQENSSVRSGSKTDVSSL